MTFTSWMNRVDAILESTCGLSSDDLADQDYRDMYDDEMSPREAAESILEDEGFEF